MNELAIICVDDDPEILSSLEMEIKEVVGNTYLIELAENGEDALEIYEELSEEGHEITLVISDYIMPNMKGDELLKRIHLRSPKTIKIMLTGQADIEAVSHAIHYANLYRYIPKPWQPADLRLTVKEALNTYLQNQKLAEYTDELEKNNQALIKLNQDKNEFLGIAAHDLKNPLSVIQGYAEMIIEDYDDMSKSEVVEVNHLILNSSRQMCELVRNLLDVNAIESGKINAELSRVDILPTVQILANTYSTRAKTKNISVQLHQQQNQYDAFVDKNTVHQILDNLISNAVKYSPHGKHINIRMRQLEEKICCEIQDEGTGLSTEDQQKLFSKFTRLTPKPTGKEHSTGLGLFIVKKLVEAMNGNVWCESELGKGTSFFVEFPVFLSTCANKVSKDIVY
ncbi:hybrid sensor histidine kinase/response regulator [Candidatus Parabeggiatoa sp. HSG14]|uniref:hybrid sensor histidine kinase/response regulator n=1 Tax=Candidatus Parabeggiatoa sp. HSG14 TaxID=3055593 RepID=UPI0025A88B8D|nr:hybrid sensor histidine kinase/response regulator [Thiotrichales bacterium HSG14]